MKRFDRSLSLTPALVLLAALLSVAQAAPIRATGTWSWVNPLPNGNSLNAVSCPDPHTCIAVGSATVMTSHGPGQWSQQINPGFGSFLALSCPAAATCYAVSNDATEVGIILGTTDGGMTWSRLRGANGTLLTALSCPSTTVCYAASEYAGTIVSTTDGGKTWSTRKIPFRPVALACPTATICYAPIDTSLVNSPPPSVAVSTNSGSTWTLHSVNLQAQLWTIQCVSASACYVIAFTGSPTQTPLFLGSRDTGQTWERYAFPKNTYFRGSTLTCPDPRTCYLAGDNGSPGGVLLATSSAGRSWAFRTSLTGLPQGLACATPIQCVAVGVGGTIERTTDGWTTWTYENRTITRKLATLQQRDSLNALACPSATTCYAVGDRATFVGTRNLPDPHTWHARTRALARAHITADLSTLTCPTTSTCFAGSTAQYPPGSGATTYLTRNGGKSWAADPGKGFAVVACPTSSVCYAGGENGAVRVSHTVGRTWTTERTPLGRGYTIETMICPTAATCLAGAIGPSEPPPHPSSNLGALLSTTDGGKSWTLTRIDPYPLSVACRDALDCFALLASSYRPRQYVTHDAGRTWSLYSALPTPVGVTWLKMTCSDSSTCDVVGTGGAVATTHDAGQTWTLDQTPTFNSLQDIHCVARDRCVTVGLFGTILLGHT